MPQNHLQSNFFHPVTDKLSIAYWSFTPTGQCLVFVHGFGGSPVETWTEFDRRLPARSTDDVFFFGYDGLFRHASESAVDLQEILLRLATDPAWIFARSVPAPAHRPPAFAYNRIVVVAHSLGAVVARRALLDA